MARASTVRGMGVFSTFAPRFVGVLLVAACSGRDFESAKTGASSKQSAGGASGSTGGRSEASDGPGGDRAGGAGGVKAGGASSSGGGAAGSQGGASASGGLLGAGGAGPGGGVPGSGGASSTGGATNGGVVSSGGGPSMAPDASVSDAGPIACTAAKDCPSPGTVCQKAACVGAQCVFLPEPNATPANTRGDCRTIICSQSGTETILADPTDISDDNECTADACRGNTASHEPSLGARCANGTKYCDSSGACVQCLLDGQCPSAGTPDECSASKCVQGGCRIPAAGTFCHNGMDQCDGAGTCVDCWDSLGCGSCCFCQDTFCIQG
jgi:hypothetical protein